MAKVNYRPTATRRFEKIRYKADVIFQELAENTGFYIDLYHTGHPAAPSDVTRNLDMSPSINFLIRSTCASRNGIKTYTTAELEDHIYSSKLTLNREDLYLDGWYRYSGVGIDVADGNLTLAEIVKHTDCYIVYIHFDILAYNSPSELKILEKIVDEVKLIVTNEGSA